MFLQEDRTVDTWVFTEQTILSMPTPQECDGSYAYKHEKEPSSFLGRIFMDLRCSPSTLLKNFSKCFTTIISLVLSQYNWLTSISGTWLCLSLSWAHHFLQEKTSAKHLGILQWTFPTTQWLCLSLFQAHHFLREKTWAKHLGILQWTPFWQHMQTFQTHN